MRKSSLLIQHDEHAEIGGVAGKKVFVIDNAGNQIVDFLLSPPNDSPCFSVLLPVYKLLKLFLLIGPIFPVYLLFANLESVSICLTCMTVFIYGYLG
jgi:hypothetical protein